MMSTGIFIRGVRREARNGMKNTGIAGMIGMTGKAMIVTEGDAKR